MHLYFDICLRIILAFIVVFLVVIVIMQSRILIENIVKHKDLFALFMLVYGSGLLILVIAALVFLLTLPYPIHMQYLWIP